MAVDAALNKYIGLPEGYVIDKIEAFGLYDYLAKLTGKSIPMSPLVLMYYCDHHGDFTKSNKRKDKIVTDIYNNMDSKDRFSVMEYITFIENKD